MRVCLSQPHDVHFSVGTLRALALGALGALGLLAVATFCAEHHADMNLRGMISEAEPQRQGRRLPDDQQDIELHDQQELLREDADNVQREFGDLHGMSGWGIVMQDMKKELQFDELANYKAASDIFKDIGRSLASAKAKFASDDPKMVAAGVCDLTGPLAQVLTMLKNPMFKKAGIFVNTMSSLVGGFLGFMADSPPGVESVVTKVVTDVVGKLLHEQTADELKALVQGEAQVMQSKLTVLTTMSQAALRNNLTLTKKHWGVFESSLSDYMEAGERLSGRILFYIDRDSTTDSRSKADEVVVLQMCWGKLATLRMQLLTHMASLLGMNGGDKPFQEMVLKEMKKLNVTIMSRMKLGDAPTDNTKLEVYRRTMIGEGKTVGALQYFEQLRVAFGGDSFPGEFCMLCNRNTKACIYLPGFDGRPDSDLQGQAILVEAKYQTLFPKNGFLFRRFNETSGSGGTAYSIFSMAALGYLHYAQTCSNA